MTTPTETRFCISKDIACTGVNPCAKCEEVFFVAIVEQALLAAGVDKDQLVRFVDTYWMQLATVKADLAKKAIQPQQVQPQSPQTMGQVAFPSNGGPATGTRKKVAPVPSAPASSTKPVIEVREEVSGKPLPTKPA